MQRPGIVNHGRNSRCLEVGLQRIALAILHLQRVLVEDMGGGGSARGNNHAFNLAQACIVVGGGFLACLNVGVEVGQFDTQYRGLQCIQPAIAANDVVAVLDFLAVVGDHAQLLRQGSILCIHGSAIAHASEVF